MTSPEDCAGQTPAKKARACGTASSSFTFMANDVDAWLAHYHHEGFVVLRGVLDVDAIASAKSGCSEFVDRLASTLVKRGVVKSELKELPLETRLWELCKSCPEEMPILIRPELHEAEFFPLLCSPALLEAVRKVVRSPELRIFPNYTARPKTPSGLHDVAWHQDAGIQGDGMPNNEPVEARLDAFGVDACVNCWTPLVPITVQNGAMKFVPKSHTQGILRHEQIGEHQRNKLVTSINQEDVTRLESGAIDMECEVGDVILFSNILVHRGGTNTSDHIRWSLDWRFQDASKPTCRDLNGHIVYSEVDPLKVVATAEQWAQLRLS